LLLVFPSSGKSSTMSGLLLFLTACGIVWVTCQTISVSAVVEKQKVLGSRSNKC
jgi:hypothetical protein